MRRPAVSAVLTVVGFLLISAAAAVLGSIASALWGAGLGLLVAGMSALLLGWLAEPGGGEQR